MFYIKLIFASIVTTVLSLPFTFINPAMIPIVFLISLVVFCLDEIRQSLEKR